MALFQEIGWLRHRRIYNKWIHCFYCKNNFLLQKVFTDHALFPTTRDRYPTKTFLYFTNSSIVAATSSTFLSSDYHLHAPEKHCRYHHYSLNLHLYSRRQPISVQTNACSHCNYLNHTYCIFYRRKSIELMSYSAPSILTFSVLTPS